MKPRYVKVGRFRGIVEPYEQGARWQVVARFDRRWDCEAQGDVWLHRHSDAPLIDVYSDPSVFTGEHWSIQDLSDALECLKETIAVAITEVEHPKENI